MADTQSDLVKSNDYSDHNIPKGMMLCSKATYIIPAAAAPGIGDLVEMVPVPAGAVVVDVIVSGPAGTASMTCDVGDAAQVDRYVDGVTASAAFQVAASADGDVANAGCGHAYAAADTIDITFNTAAPTAADEYTLLVLYFMG